MTSPINKQCLANFMQCTGGRACPLADTQDGRMAIAACEQNCLSGPNCESEPHPRAKRLSNRTKTKHSVKGHIYRSTYTPGLPPTLT